MTEQESIESRLGRIEEHLRHIDQHLERQLICRHVTVDGDCDFFAKVEENTKKIDQWTGALAAVSLLCAFIGSVIGVVLSKLLK